ncbi:tetratricopeptide repeat protein 23 isoform X4 [Lampetra fluviatilis]
MATSNGGSDGDARRPFVLEVPSGRWDEADGAADENLNSSHSSDHTETPSTRPSGSARERRRRKRGGDFTSGEWNSPPEDKLPIATKMAEAHMRNKQIPEAMTELIRCVALSRIVFGDEHWQVAQAYANLAHGYLSLRGLALQAKLHCETGQAIMLTAPHSPSSPGERTNILKTLFTIYCTLGKANTHLKNLKEAEQCLLRAEQIANELSKTGMVLEREQGEMDLEVTQALGRLSIQQEKPALAVEQLQKTLKLLQLSVGEDSPELIPAYQDLAHAEDARQNHQQTIENLLQAHSIALASYTTDSKEAAETAHIMAKACAAAKDEEFEGSNCQAPNLPECQGVCVWGVQQGTGGDSPPHGRNPNGRGPIGKSLQTPQQVSGCSNNPVRRSAQENQVYTENLGHALQDSINGK